MVPGSPLSIAPSLQLAGGHASAESNPIANAHYSAAFTVGGGGAATQWLPWAALALVGAVLLWKR